MKKKKKPKRKKRQPKTKESADNNVSYVDELGKPISNEIINNRSFSSTFVPQPFSRNSTIIGTSFNESTIMDKVIEKMSKLNTLNQSMNNSILNQSTAAPAPPQLPRRPIPAPSTIVPASPSVAPQSLNFDLTSPVRPVVGLTPLQASSMLNPVQQYILASQRASITSQDTLKRIFRDVTDMEQAEIKRATTEIIMSEKSYSDLMKAPVGGARKSKFKSVFKEKYKGTMYPEDASNIGYDYAKSEYGI